MFMSNKKGNGLMTENHDEKKEARKKELEKSKKNQDKMIAEKVKQRNQDAKKTIDVIPGIFTEIYLDVIENSSVPRNETAWATALTVMSCAIGRTMTLNDIMPTFRTFVILPSSQGKNIVKQASLSILEDVGLKPIIGSSNITSESSLVDEFGMRPHCPELLCLSDECHTMLKKMGQFGVETCINQLASTQWGDPLQTRRMISAQGIRKNTNLGEGVKSPFFNLLGLTTPDNFFDIMASNPQMKTSGFLGRSICLFSKQMVRAKPKNPSNFARSVDALMRISNLCNFAERSKRMLTPPPKDPTVNHENAYRSLTNKLSMTDDAREFLAEKMKSIGGLAEEREEMMMPHRVDFDRIGERLLALSIIAHISINADASLQRPVGLATLEMVSDLDRAIAGRSLSSVYLISHDGRTKKRYRKLFEKVFHVLKENRVMMPGELANSITIDGRRLKAHDLTPLFLVDFIKEDVATGGVKLNVFTDMFDELYYLGTEKEKS